MWALEAAGSYSICPPFSWDWLLTLKLGLVLDHQAASLTSVDFLGTGGNLRVCASCVHMCM